MLMRDLDVLAPVRTKRGIFVRVAGVRGDEDVLEVVGRQLHIAAPEQLINLIAKLVLAHFPRPFVCHLQILVAASDELNLLLVDLRRARNGAFSRLLSMPMPVL